MITPNPTYTVLKAKAIPVNKNAMESTKIKLNPEPEFLQFF